MAGGIERATYILDNGASLSYVYTPGRSIGKLIQDVVAEYRILQKPVFPPFLVYLRLDLYKNALLEAKYTSDPVTKDSTGELTIVVWPGNTSVRLIPQMYLEWPLFYGTEAERELNEFDLKLDDVLAR